jgi:hypothetical protein
MKRLRACFFSAGLIAFLATFSLWGQTGGSQPQPPSTGGGSGSAPRQPGSVQSGSAPPSNRSQNSIQEPMFVSGQIIVEDGQPLPEPLSVELNCAARSRSRQAIHTDRKGFFEFALGLGPQGNTDLSASSDSPFGTGPVSTNSSGGNGSMINTLMGCEVRVSAPGYQPLSYTIFNPPDLNRIEVGTLILKHLGTASGSSISVISLQAPGNARKEFEKGETDFQSKHFKTAEEHLEKAVSLYDRYAAAWSELGRVYFANNEAQKASQAFDKAISIEPQYVAPYISLANLQLLQEKDEDAVATAEKALQLEPGNPMAGFVAAAGNFNLNRLDAAEKNALEAEPRAAGSMPQLHALLADIFLQKHDDQKAASYIRTYLKESPKGQFADQLKKDLQRIDAAAGNAPTETAPSAAAH